MPAPKEIKEEVTPIQQAILHSAVMLKGKTETNLSTIKIPKLEMHWTTDGIVVTQPVKALIPAANVKTIYY